MQIDVEFSIKAARKMSFVDQNGLNVLTRMSEVNLANICCWGRYRIQSLEICLSLLIIVLFKFDLSDCKKLLTAKTNLTESQD